eukprot:scaffold149_cov383-Prasinococcus_capsulatus_cf.AAC.28
MSGRRRPERMSSSIASSGLRASAAETSAGRTWRGWRRPRVRGYGAPGVQPPWTAGAPTPPRRGAGPESGAGARRRAARPPTPLTHILTHSLTRSDREADRVVVMMGLGLRVSR